MLPLHHYRHVRVHVRQRATEQFLSCSSCVPDVRVLFARLFPVCRTASRHGVSLLSASLRSPRSLLLLALSFLRYVVFMMWNLVPLVWNSYLALFERAPLSFAECLTLRPQVRGLQLALLRFAAERNDTVCTLRMYRKCLLGRTVLPRCWCLTGWPAT